MSQGARLVQLKVRMTVVHVFYVTRLLQTRTMEYHVKSVIVGIMVNVSDEDYKSLSNKPNMHWYCTLCNKGVAKLLEFVRKVEEKQDEFERALIDCRGQMDLFKEEVKTLKVEVWALVTWQRVQTLSWTH